MYGKIHSIVTVVLMDLLASFTKYRDLDYIRTW
jgi:hypothetical protein